MKVQVAVLGAIALSLCAAFSPVAAVDDVDVLNFALNLEYLEAEFYQYATSGHGIPSQYRGGGPRSTGGRRTVFRTATVKSLAAEIAEDELNHVRFLRMALSSAAVPIPKLDIGPAFAAAADAAFMMKLQPSFSPYSSSNFDLLFLTGAFIFEDVGVTAYKGAAKFIANKDYLGAAAGILAVEAYHAGAIRTLLYTKANTRLSQYMGVKVYQVTAAISNLRASVGDGKDQGIAAGPPNSSNIVPTDGNSIVFGRTTSQVLAIVYLGGKGQGGFFPSGLNGNIK